MSKDCNKCRRGNANTATPAPDTSPGDELEAILLEVQKNTDAWWNTPQPEYKGKYPAIMRAEAKDRLNRLMLQARKEEAEEILRAAFENLGPEVYFAKERLKGHIAAIDAQLNKEETDGDIYNN